MKINQSEFDHNVSIIVSAIPKGKVMTYGQVAALLGYPRAAQMVGWTLHWANQTKTPYQRVVNRFGGLAGGYPHGGRDRHKKDLKSEGVAIRKDFTVDLAKYLWQPEPGDLPPIKFGHKTLNILDQIPFK